MGKKNYSDEFKRDAVALYRDTDGATLASIAKDLGINDVTLASWCKTAGVPIRHHRPSPGPVAAGGSGETPDEELARLRAEVRELKSEKTKLTTERDILRSAAKYFAGETRW
jgi:transposase